MARKLKPENSGKNAGDVDVDQPTSAPLANSTFDPDLLVQHVQEVIGKADELTEQGQPLKDRKKELKSEFGYNMKAFGVCLSMERAEPLEARDMWLTIKAYAEHKGLDSPDLVDLMEPEKEAA